MICCISTHFSLPYFVTQVIFKGFIDSTGLGVASEVTLSFQINGFNHNKFMIEQRVEGWIGFFML